MQKEFIPFENREYENNCFINVVVQLLFHSEEFKNNFLKLKITFSQNNPLFYLQSLFKDYKSLLYSNSFTKLETNYLRKTLILLYKNYFEGAFGDSIEILNHIFNMIHSYCTINDYSKENDSLCEPLCASHKSFGIKLKEIIFCQNCKKKRIINYDNNYFAYEIFCFEIIDYISGKKLDFFQNNLFKIAKKIISEDIQVKIEKCRCKEKNYVKYLNLIENNSNYFIINLTWESYSPKLTEICKIYNLIPLIEENTNLFEIDNKKNISKFYLYGIIVFFDYHYACCIKSELNRDEWILISDYDIYSFDNYKQLIRNLIINNFHPVILFYRKKRIFANENEENCLFNNDEYYSIYDYCKEEMKKIGISIPVSKNASNNSLSNIKRTNSVKKAYILYKNSKKDMKNFNENNNEDNNNNNNDEDYNDNFEDDNNEEENKNNKDEDNNNNNEEDEDNKETNEKNNNEEDEDNNETNEKNNNEEEDNNETNEKNNNKEEDNNNNEEEDNNNNNEDNNKEDDDNNKEDDDNDTNKIYYRIKSNNDDKNKYNRINNNENNKNNNRNYNRNNINENNNYNNRIYNNSENNQYNNRNNNRNNINENYNNNIRSNYNIRNSNINNNNIKNNNNNENNIKNKNIENNNLNNYNNKIENNRNNNKNRNINNENENNNNKNNNYNRNNNNNNKNKIVFENNEFWYCPNCRKRNRILTQKCWNCHNNFSNIPTLKNNEIYVDNFDSDEEEEEEEEKYYKTFINPLNDVKKLNNSFKNYKIEKSSLNVNKNYSIFNNNFWECPRCHNNQNSIKYNLCKICAYENENLKGF